MAKDLTDALAGKIATVVRELTEYGDCPSTAEGLCDIVVALKDVAAGIRDFRDVEEMVLVLRRRLWLAISTRLEAKQEEQRRSNVEMYIEERRARLIEANKAA